MTLEERRVVETPDVPDHRPPERGRSSRSARGTRPATPPDPRPARRAPGTAGSAARLRRPGRQRDCGTRASIRRSRRRNRRRRRGSRTRAAPRGAARSGGRGSAGASRGRSADCRPASRGRPDERCHEAPVQDEEAALERPEQAVIKGPYGSCAGGDRLGDGGHAWTILSCSAARRPVSKVPRRGRTGPAPLGWRSTPATNPGGPDADRHRDLEPLHRRGRRAGPGSRRALGRRVRPHSSHRLLAGRVRGAPRPAPADARPAGGGRTAARRGGAPGRRLPRRLDQRRGRGHRCRRARAGPEHHRRAAGEHPLGLRPDGPRHARGLGEDRRAPRVPCRPPWTATVRRSRWGSPRAVRQRAARRSRWRTSARPGREAATAAGSRDFVAGAATAGASDSLQGGPRGRRPRGRQRLRPARGVAPRRVRAASDGDRRLGRRALPGVGPLPPGHGPRPRRGLRLGLGGAGAPRGREGEGVREDPARRLVPRRPRAPASPIRRARSKASTPTATGSSR